MLQGILVKKVLDLVMKQVLKQFKLDKVLDYVEKPNDLDKQMEVLQKKVNKYGKVIEEIEKDVAEVKSIKDRFGKKARF
tara:strand:+ start:649 stop:885 length:237 start_codon:yes stop_codon:yes gene_type:complete